MSPRWFAGIVGGVLVLVALIMLGSPTHADVPAFSSTMDMSCGSVFSPDSTLRGETKRACDDALAGHRTWGFVLGGIGLIAMLGAATIQLPGQRSEPDREATA